MRLAACMRDMDTKSAGWAVTGSWCCCQRWTMPPMPRRSRRRLSGRLRCRSTSARAITVTCSVGIAVFPDDADDAGTLVRHADFAMYLAKQAGHGCFRRYRPSAQGKQLAASVTPMLRPRRDRWSPRRRWPSPD